MPPSIPVFVAFSLSVAFVQALISINTPTSVAADTPFNATLTAEYHPLRKATYAYALRVYLASSAQEKINSEFYRTDCYLIHEQTLCDPTISIDVDGGVAAFDNTPFTVTIPSTVGPSGRHYVLAARVMNTDGSYYTGQMFSDVFDLTGANGTWTNVELQGRTLWGDDGIPCSGFSCVKECANAPNVVTTNGTYHKCINSCPGVSVDPESSQGGYPTATRVKPSACPDSAASSAIATATFTTPSGTSASSSRTAAAAARTGAAVSRLSSDSIFPVVIPALMAGLLG